MSALLNSWKLLKSEKKGMGVRDGIVMIDIVHCKDTWCPRGGEYFDTIVIYDDYWNDFAYKTTFHMVAFDQEGLIDTIGDLKIYYYDFDEARTDRYGAKVSDVLPPNIVQLSDKFCSLGQNLAFYIKLKQLFPDSYLSILTRLNDMATNEEIKARFINERGVQTSLLRDSSAEKALNEAAVLLLKKRLKKKDVSFSYRANVPYSEQKTDLYFDFKKTDDLPFRINALIGKNGAGKTQILSNLAEDLSGLKDTVYERNSAFVGKRPSIDKVISISFSAFDAFRKRSSEDEKYFTNSYVYCGIQSSQGTLSLEQLHQNFKESFDLIQRKGRMNAWKSVMSELIEEEHIALIEGIMENEKELHFSSGQNILICTITEALANIENESLILFDEPELHLHPNAIANTMRMLYRLLNEFDSYAIIATHSPLIIQEIPSRYIQTLIRISNVLTVHRPDNECFGENVTKITNDIFDVKSTESNYKSVLRKLSQKMDFEDILELFDGKLSFNAMIYLKNCCEERNAE